MTASLHITPNGPFNDGIKFSQAFPELTDAEWEALKQSHAERVKNSRRRLDMPQRHDTVVSVQRVQTERYAR